MTCGRILVASDAWRPQINGVVRTYENVRACAETLGVELCFLTPSEFRTVLAPTYPEIRLALPNRNVVARCFEAFQPDAVHIATEGPVGWMARRHCLQNNVPFTTSFHTRFPDYLYSRFGLPKRWIWSLLRRFHNAGAGTMVATQSLVVELEGRGFSRLLSWTRGVDTTLFRPRGERMFGAGPVFLYVGRVAVEKNLPAFLDLELPGRKVVVGDGPQLKELRSRYGHVEFTGRKVGEDLARAYASGDVFVMPSRTETFGIVLLEAIASGLPVAAFPVTGPVDVLRNGLTGIVSEDLGAAALAALELDRARVRNASLEFGWDRATRLFLANIDTAIFTSHGRRSPFGQFSANHRPHSA